MTLKLVPTLSALLLGSLAAVQAAQPAPGGVKPNAGMLRYPDVSATHIAFVYANDIWLVPREGGTAAPLASPPGPELFPRFNAFGDTLSFSGNYDGNRDLYTLPLEGGIPTRVTHHPSSEQVPDWTPDGKLIFSSNGLSGLPSQQQLYTVPAKGGLPARLPVPYGTNGAIDPTGRWLAYTPHSIDNRTWKRYRGGMATDIWLFDLQEKKSKRMTDWEGTDSLPMWQGTTVYYLSDQGTEHRLNLWKYDTKNGRRDQVTHLTDFDVKWPAIGPGKSGKGEIVFQYGPTLQLLDLATGQAKAVDVRIPGARPQLRPRAINVEPFIKEWALSPTGKRAAVEARGDIWTVPSKEGSPRDLTRTSGAAERDPAWSPDGKWLAYFSDASGDYELYVVSADGKGEPRQLTRAGDTYRYDPTWSPDSKQLVTTDKAGNILLHKVESGETKLVDRDPWGQPDPVRWSPDSRWLAYDRGSDRSQRTAIWLYNTESGEKKQVTSGMFNDILPTFDRKGDYLFFISSRSFQPLYEDLGTTWVYAGTQVLVAAPLRADVKAPYAPKSDEEVTGDSTKPEAPKPAAGTPPPTVIELEGLEERAIQLPAKAGSFGNIAVNDKNQLLYLRRGARGSGDPTSVQLLDLADDKRQERVVAADATGFELSADGKKAMISRPGGPFLQDAAPGAAPEKIPTTGMVATIDPRAEWRQMFEDAWRIEKLFFYDPTMHGVDWKAVHDQYVKLLADCASREDVGYVISEMISELNVGHAYYSGGDVEGQPQVPVGLLGTDFELQDGAYKISRIYRGAAWDVDARGPLAEAGGKIKEGDYLLAVNGVPIDVSQDPWAAFQGLAGRSVTVTVSDRPRMDESARDVVVRPAATEMPFRYRAWIEKNRAYVDRVTGGKIGYVYVPDTGVRGQNDLFRQFVGQNERDALIIDERWNGGGQIPTRFIELLNRPITNYWARRDGKDWPWPPDAHQGPKAMLINGLAGSGGDAFPWYFRQAKLGKLIGTRTWGGLVGITDYPDLVDGAEVTAPNFAFYRKEGTWAIEGHGVDPDIEVLDDPALMTDGGDPQLDAAIKELLDELKKNPYTPPKRPAYPNRSGFGLPERDR